MKPLEHERRGGRRGAPRGCPTMGRIGPQGGHEACPYADPHFD